MSDKKNIHFSCVPDEMEELLKTMTQISDDDYQFICQMVYEYSRINLGDNKKELVTSRLGKRLRAHKLSTFSEYCKLLKSPLGEDEVTHLVDCMSTNHTHFFREIKHFDFMRETALPDWVKRGANEKKFRLWSAASSSGEEPYSLAIQLSEFFQIHSGWQWSIEGTDISTRILEKAKQGVYHTDRLKDVTPDLIKKYFQKGFGEWEGYYRVKEPVREKLNFTNLNLLQDTYPFKEKFHVIFCRNVMIYFDRPTQEQLVNHMHDYLLPGGYLMIGHSESLTGIRQPFKALRPAIYQKSI